MIIWCSTRNPRNLRALLRTNPDKIRIFYIPFPVSIPVLLVQRYSDTKLRLYGSRHEKRIVIKCMLKELWLDVKCNSPYFFVLFRLFLVSIKSQKEDSKDFLKTLNESEYSRFILSRSAICDFQKIGLNISSFVLTKIQNEGIGIPSNVLAKMGEQRVWVWRFQNHLTLLTPISATDYLSKIAEERRIHTLPKADKVIQIIELSEANISKGLFAEKSGEIVPTSSYFFSEITRELPILGLFMDNGQRISVVSPKHSIELRRGVFAGFNSNYYHFTWEILPRLVHFYQKEESRAIPTILSRNSPDSISEMILELSGTYPVLIGDDESARVQQLYVLSDSRYRNQVDFTDQTHANIFNERREDLSKIRALFSEKELSESKSRPRRIFVGRPQFDLRIPSNLNQIDELLESNGYHKIQPEGMSFASQVSIFRDAEEICILAGAAVTNLMYCKKLRKVVILIVDLSSLSARKFWQDYCAFPGIEATFLYAGDAGKGFGPIDISALNAALT